MIVPPRYDECAYAYEADGPAGELEPPPYSPPPYEDDEEYDVYFYCPTVSPFLIPATKPAEDKLAALLLHLKTTTTKEQEQEDLPPQSSTSSQPSPADTRNTPLDNESDSLRRLDLPLSSRDIVDSNETFLAHSVGGMDEAGYGRLFRAGLAAESHNLNRQSDTLRSKFQQLFLRSPKMLTSDSR